jgi:hypothetical protein
VSLVSQLYSEIKREFRDVHRISFTVRGAASAATTTAIATIAYAANGRITIAFVIFMMSQWTVAAVATGGQGDRLIGFISAGQSIQGNSSCSWSSL